MSTIFVIVKDSWMLDESWPPQYIGYTHDKESAQAFIDKRNRLVQAFQSFAEKLNVYFSMNFEYHTYAQIQEKYKQEIYKELAFDQETIDVIDQIQVDGFDLSTCINYKIIEINPLGEDIRGI